jgi:hypothetical protein
MFIWRLCPDHTEGEEEVTQYVPDLVQSITINYKIMWYEKLINMNEPNIQVFIQFLCDMSGIQI